MHVLEEFVRKTYPLADRRKIKTWAGGTPPRHEDAAVIFGSDMGFQGPFNIDNVPWNQALLDAVESPHVREITYIAPAQESGKTKTSEVVLAYMIDQHPCPMAFNTTTNVKAKGWHDMRWVQLQKACKRIDAKLSSDPDDSTKSRYVFADKTFLIIQGAETDGNRQGDSVKFQINDEVHLWDKPWLSEMHTRTRAFREVRKIINISLGADKGSELHEKFLEGNRLEYGHYCPDCDEPFEYIFDRESKGCNIHFDTSKVKVDTDGAFDWREFDASVYVSCPHCNHKMQWSEELMAKLKKRGAVFIPRNPDANPEFVSIHVNAFAIGRRPWHEIIHTWAKIFVKGGVFSLNELRKFIVDDLAEFWEEKPISVSRDLCVGEYQRADMAVPNIIPSFKEWIRAMAIDNQRGAQGDREHRIFVARAFTRTGSSRLIDSGKKYEWEELRELQTRLGIPDPTDQTPGPWVVVDRAHDPVQVDKVCAKYRWTGFLGQDTDEYIHPDDSDWPGARALFSDCRKIDVGFGTEDQGRIFALYHLWSSQRVQDILAALRSGKGPRFEVPRDINDFDPAYAKEINSHRSVIEKDKKKGTEKRIWKKFGEDHRYDGESMLVVIGLMAGVYNFIQ